MKFYKQLLNVAASAAATFVLCAFSFPEKASGTRTLPNMPADGAELNITPPGFTWWRAGAVDSLRYVVRVFNDSGQEVLTSEPSDLCRWKPSKVLPAGSYTWTVEALDRGGQVMCSRAKSSFSILPGAMEFPMPDVAASLKKVSKKHPRLVFDSRRINEIAAGKESSYAAEFASLDKICAKGLEMELFPEPVFNTMPSKAKSDFRKMREVYQKEFGQYAQYARGQVLGLGLKYLLTGDAECGEAAKRHLLRMSELQIDGGGPIITHNGGLDEIGLITADVMPWVYDWTYKLYTKAEREQIETFMVELMNAYSHRLSPQGYDYLSKISDSHSGRLPAYEFTFAMCLKERPEAAVWLEQALQFCFTNYPYWACPDGGWAEGVAYSTGYTAFLISSFECLRRQTGINLFDLPFIRNYPKFIYYMAVRNGENTPFGDQEEFSPTWATLGSTMHFIACATGNSELRWMASKFEPTSKSTGLGSRNIQQNLTFRDIKPEQPEVLPNSKVFPAVGCAGLHSDIRNLKTDLAFLFRSSPFGSVSHSHMDQNTFAIMYGGTSLAIPAGYRYPVASSPFHEEYTRTTQAHNGLLFGGRGQVERTQAYYGTIVDSAESEHLSYVCGQAATAYTGVRKFYRHCLMVRPSVVIIYDEYELEKAEKVDWLFHAKEEMAVSEDGRFVSSHKGKSLYVRLFGSMPFAVSQTSEWPVNPKKGFEFSTRKDVEKQWHLDACFEAAAAGQIVAVMTVDEGVTYECSRVGNGYEISISFPDGASAAISIDGGRFSAQYGSERIKSLSRN